MQRILDPHFTYRAPISGSIRSNEDVRERLLEISRDLFIRLICLIDECDALQ